MGGRREKVAEELDVQCQFLAGRVGGEVGSQVEPVSVEDERVENENQDDGAGPDKEMCLYISSIIIVVYYKWRKREL